MTGADPAAAAELIASLRLIRTDHVGPITHRQLTARFGSARAALDALPDLSRRAGRTLRPPPVADAERELAAIDRLGARLIGLADPAYPAWLHAIDGAPPLVIVRGDTAALARPMVAIGGSRNASAAGRRMASLLAAELGRAGIVVVSGLARGIDATAHEASLATGTVAVLAGGLDRIYPPENIPLAEAIAASSGCLLSEMPLGWEPRARDFPRRNRLVSGLAMGVVVVEAAERSGTLITARYAAEQGRTVFAVPGSPLDPRAAGTNGLLKQGATLTTGVDDVLSALAPMLQDRVASSLRETRVEAPSEEAAPDERARILEALGPTPTEIDEIVRFSRASPGAVQLVLLELDLAGRLDRHPGQRVSLLP